MTLTICVFKLQKCALISTVKKIIRRRKFIECSALFFTTWNGMLYLKNG
jgi:hypothetical protein